MEMNSTLIATGMISVLLQISALAEDGTVSALQKVTCGTMNAGAIRNGMVDGRAYSRAPNEKDHHLFGRKPINTRRCNVVEDKRHGNSFHSVCRKIMVYIDPETLDEWINPWIGDTIEVMHVANDPVNMRAYRYEQSEDREPFEFSIRHYGDVTVPAIEVSRLYDNPLGSEYQDYVGRRHNRTEIFNNFYNTEKLLGPEITNVGQNEVAWTRAAQWLAWMEMSDRAGAMIFNATGSSTLNQDDLHAELVEGIETRYPEHAMPSSLNDDRKNETSWKVLKKKRAEK